MKLGDKYYRALQDLGFVMSNTEIIWGIIGFWVYITLLAWLITLAFSITLGKAFIISWVIFYIGEGIRGLR
jgi:hypothetical protein